MTEELREELAALCHNQWVGWMEYLFSKCIELPVHIDDNTGTIIIPRDYVERWKRQINTPYEELSASEKESDRKEADRFISLLYEYKVIMGGGK